jgi:pimeloyl-ACP methyl ester carboxylesterase/DNA-binding CsgD family transcriptional regulator
MRRTVTRYALSGSTRIAYQVIGQGPRDLVLIPAFPCNLEILPEDPGYSRLIRRLSRFCRLIVFDPRGSGLSDGLDPAAPADRDTRVADLVAVMDAAGSGRAALLGAGEGAAQALLLAARQPARVRAIVLYGAHAAPRSRAMPRADDPGLRWGQGALMAQIAPSRANDPDFATWWGRLERFAASPSAASAQIRMIAATDASDLLAAISAPCLLLHRSEDLLAEIAGSRALCAKLPGARLVELPGGDHPIWLGDVDTLADHVEEFLTGAKAASFETRVLAVTLATRVLGPSGSTGSAAAGRHMDERLALFREAVPRLTARHGGAAGWPQDDRLDAAFDSATRALACAVELRDAAHGIGLALAQGIHVGDIDRAHATPSGPAVQIAARIAEATRNPEIVLSRLASELVMGAGMHFVDRGSLPGQDGHAAPLPLVALSAERHLEPLGRAGTKFADFELLSTRERQVVKLIAAGGTNPQIAVQLGLSEHTVKRHVANILLKLDLPSRAAAASLAARQIDG